MSRQSLIRFLEKLDKELYGSSSAYRKEADGREMTFTFNAKRFVSALEKEFKFRDLDKEFNAKDVQSFMYKGATDILTACSANAKQFKQTRGVVIRRNQYALKVIIASEINPKTDKNFSNFEKLKKLYKEELDSFVLSLNTYLKENYGKRLNKTKRKFDKSTFTYSLVEDTNSEVEYGSDLIEGGHEEGQGILESRIADAIDTAINQKYTRQVTKDNLKTNLDLLGIDLGFVRDDTTDRHSIFAQSRVENQETGFMSGAEKRKFQNQLRAAINKLNAKEPIVGLKGSDSIEEFKTKQVEYQVMKELGKTKGAKTTKTKKPKPTKRMANKPQKSKKSKVVNSSLPLAKVSKRGRPSKRARKSVISFTKLFAILKSRINPVVAKNMGSPALNYRTGRFAASVDIIDVSPTAQGFPSVGYTYMKRPYQTFEPGFLQGSPDRDPRKLIDTSIREIASQLAVGRLYTRRL